MFDRIFNTPPLSRIKAVHVDLWANARKYFRAKTSYHVRYDQLVSYIGIETSESFSINLFLLFSLHQNDIDFFKLPTFYVVIIAIVLSRVTISLKELT